MSTPSTDVEKEGTRHVHKVKAMPDTPLGIQKVFLWNKLKSRSETWLIIVGIVLMAWAKNWEGNTVYTVRPYVTNEFGASNQYALLDTVLYLLTSVLVPIYSRMSDIWGRTEVFTVAILFYIVSGIVMAVSQSMNDMLGSQVIYAFGLSGVNLMGHVVIADISTKTNRGLLQAFYDVPAIINIFVAPVASERISTSSNWRWVYSMIPFSIGGTALILLPGLYRLEWKMRKTGMLQDIKAQLKEGEQVETWRERIWRHIRDFDLIGTLLLAGGLCMVLLALSLGPYDFGGWDSSRTVGLLVGGFVTLLVFIAYEQFVAPVKLAPVKNWPTWTPIAGVCCITLISTVTGITWGYYLVYLQISRRWGPVKSVHVDRSYDATYLVSQVLAGFLMRRFKVYRPILIVGISLYVLGMGFMIPSRFPDASAVFLVASQVISGFGAGLCFVTILVACQSSVPHNDLSIVTGLYQLFTTLGYAIGAAISSAVLNTMLPKQLAKNMPGEYDLTTLMGNALGSLELPHDQWLAYVNSYGNVVRIMCIVGLCLSVLAFVAVFFMKPFGLEDEKLDMIEEVSVSETESTEKTEKEKVAYA